MGVFQMLAGENGQRSGSRVVAASTRREVPSRPAAPSMIARLPAALRALQAAAAINHAAAIARMAAILIVGQRRISTSSTQELTIAEMNERSAPAANQ